MAILLLSGILPHTHKIVICGNHELSFDHFKNPVNDSIVHEALLQENVSNARQLLTNCIYLEDSLVTLFGLKIYGTPWTPEFCDWGFNLPRGQQLLDKWNQIPTGIDVLLTHGPPLGYGDMTKYGVRAGCVELLNSICKRIRPKYHVFGHIHEGYGCTTDGYTTFVNASTCTVNYKPTNPPIIFDIALPEGHDK